MTHLDGAELIVQIPEEWNATVQTPMLDAMVARGDLDFLFLAPVDKEAMIAPLQNASDTGLPIITNDTFIGDGDYVNGPVTLPISYIGSDNVLGGEIACHALAEAIGETGKVYIYAIGGNFEASMRAGIPVQRTIIWVYTIAGLLAGIAGVLWAARFTSGAANAGEASLLTAIAAVVIGGPVCLAVKGLSPVPWLVP